MEPCSLPVLSGVAAGWIACHVQDDAELSLLAALLTQLGDSLAVIAASRAACAAQSDTDGCTPET